MQLFLMLFVRNEFSFRNRTDARLRHSFNKIQLDVRIHSIQVGFNRFLLETREKKKWTKKLNETSIVEEIISSLMRSIENRGRLGTGIIEDETTREVEACLPLHIYIYIYSSLLLYGNSGGKQRRD